MSGRWGTVLRWTITVAVLVAFSVYATWPLAAHFGEAVNENDPQLFTWDIWWIARSIVHLDNPWFTRQMLAPDGSYLGFHALAPLVGLVAAPVTLLGGAVLSHDVLKLLLPPAAAIGAYALGRTLGLSRPAAWVTGAVWGFSTIAVWRTNLHMNFGGAFPLLPLVIAGAVRYERTGRRRDAALAGAALGAVALVDPTMAIFAGIALLAWILIAAFDAQRRRTWLRGIGWLAGAALLVSLPQAAMMVRTLQQGAYEPNLPLQAATWVQTGTSVRQMISPANVRTWFPGDMESWSYRHKRGEASPVYGWGALLLGIAAILLVGIGWRRRGPPDALGRRAVWWGLVVLLVGSIFALGPVLTLSDTMHRPLAFTQHGQQLSALMPYTWLTQIPLLQDVRVPSRFVMLGMLGLAVMAGFGFAALWRRGIAGRVIAVAAIAFAVVEAGYTDGGAGWISGSRERLYAPVKADPRSDSVVVDIPLGFIGSTYGAGRSPNKLEPVLRATEHGHPTAFGALGRITPEQVERLTTRPLYSAVLAQQGTGPDDDAPLPAGDLGTIRADMAATKVGWVVLWPEASRRVPGFLRSLGFTPVLRDDGVSLWKAPPAR